MCRRGEIISEAQLRLIKQMGLMTENTGASRWLFSAILMGVVFGIALIYCIYQKHSVVRDLKSAVCMILLSALGIAVALICKRIDLRLAPVFLPVIIGTVILRRKTALLYGVWMSIVISFIMRPQQAFFFDDRVLRSPAFRPAWLFCSGAGISRQAEKSRVYLLGHCSRRDGNGCLCMLRHIGMV